jgi:3'(2'), 5'-bisphosphate nucleotidase
MKTSLDVTTKQLIQIAINAGNAIMDIYKKETFNQQLKSDNSPLTEADIASNNIIIGGLKQLTPNIPILSEESAEISWKERKQWNYYWLIDPLDGTKEFINRNGEFTVNIALIEGNIPIIGVVHAPAIDQTWVGNQSEKVAIKISNGKTKYIQVKPHIKDEIWKVVGSRSHAGDSLKNYLDNLGSYELISMGSSIKLCLVAEGSAHVYPRLGPTSEWDTAAAHAVVNAAGGRVVNVENDSVVAYNTKYSLLNPHFIVYSD